MPLDGMRAGAARQRRLGWVVSGFFALFLFMDAVAHVLRPQPVVEAFAKLGVPLDEAVPLGGLLLLLVVLYLVPRTAVAGALLLTAYLGGAVAIHLRVADGMFPLLFPVLIGLGLWAGLGLRRPVVLRLLTGAE